MYSKRKRAYLEKSKKYKSKVVFFQFGYGVHDYGLWLRRPTQKNVFFCLLRVHFTVCKGDVFLKKTDSFNS